MVKTNYLIACLLAAFIALYSASCFAGSRFVDNEDGTVTDNELNLMWAQTDNQGDITWLDAYRWVKFNFYYLLPGNKFDDWRLPTSRELRSLYIKDKSRKGTVSDCGMRVRVIPEITLSCGWVWTADVQNISANVFTFRLGYYFSDLKMNKKAHRVLAVRDIKE